MLIKESYVMLTWQNSNRKRYEEKGYKFTNYGDTFMVNINDITPFSECIITAICEQCGKEKEMTLHAYNSITDKNKKKYICRECFIEMKTLKYEDILYDAKSAGYELITPKSAYKNGDTQIKYICPKHGIRKMKASNLHNGKRCSKCHFVKIQKQFSFSTNEVEKQVEELGGKLLNKNDYINNTTKNLEILCPRCHKVVFRTSLRNFIQHGGQSCENCYKKESVGERRIRQWLENNKFTFIQEKWFFDCRDIRPLPFDFYLPNENTIIEFDGQQHFTETHFFSISHLNTTNNSVTSYTKYHDDIKTKYCISNNIELIRIPYTKLNNIETILKQKLIA